MDKINVAKALKFAENNFPNAPEKLVELLGIEVRQTPLSCDGWCLQFNNRSIIRINSNSPEVRRRFTLAHELGHLIYEIPTLVGESVLTFENRSKEERMIDKFAAELLLPTSIVLKNIKEIPITAKVIQRFAKKAHVSDLAVALRIASLTTEFGLSDASVVFYENNSLKWQWSETLKIKEDTPGELLLECEKYAPNPTRITQENSKVLVASLIDNPNFNTKIVFLQLVNEKDGFKKLREEKILELELFIFRKDSKFRQSLHGKFGAFHAKAKKMSYEDAILEFNNRLFKSRYPSTLTPEQLDLLKSEKGQEYIRLKLQY